jgi:hypothetical protein
MRPTRIVPAVLLLAAAVALAPDAMAGKASSKAAADALFREGVSLADSGKFADAAAKFKASYELDPARGTLQGMAMAEERAGKLLEAYTHFNELADQAQQAGDQSRLDIAKDRLETLRKRLADLTVVLGAGVPSGTEVTVDGDALPAEAAGSALPINPGTHRVEARAPDGRQFSRTITLAEAGHATVNVTLGAAPAMTGMVAAPPARADTGERAPPVHHGSSLSTVGLIVGGAGVIAAGVGGYLWIHSGKKFDDVAARCSGTRCPADAQSDIDSGHSEERWARVGLIAGGVMVATGVTLFVVGRKGDDSPSVGATIAPTGVRVHGAF